MNLVLQVHLVPADLWDFLPQILAAKEHSIHEVLLELLTMVEHLHLGLRQVQLVLQLVVVPLVLLEANQVV